MINGAVHESSLTLIDGRMFFGNFGATVNALALQR